MRGVFVGLLAIALVAGILPLGAFPQGQAEQGQAPIDKGLGNKNAAVRVEVFSDFQCPACRDLYHYTLRPLMANYVIPGKVYLIHRDMPLSTHAHAREAARYANAAAAVGKLEPVVEALYGRQDEWGASGNVESVVARALTPAEMRRMRQVLSSERVNSSIASDVARAQSLQVRSTPSVFVTHNGKTQALPPGGVNYPLLKQYIDYLLRQ